MWKQNKTKKIKTKPKLGQHSPSSEAVAKEDRLYVHQ